MTQPARQPQFAAESSTNARLNTCHDDAVCAYHPGLFTKLSSCDLRLLLMPVAVLVALNMSLNTGSGQAVDSPEKQIDFNRQIRPILSKNCFSCHGPDQKKRRGRLRLDTREGLLGNRGSDAVVVPGNPDASLLLERVTSNDHGKLMPPAKTGKRLTLKQIKLLQRWIEQGARWSEHWAFAPPRRPDLPAVSDPNWPRNAIDHFVLARLDAKCLKPAPEADRPSLIRRVTLDLTGLPPTPVEIDDFLKDQAPDAYEKVVDRLLRSPRYGEHMARYWLDAARYGDTHGRHGDNYREMWLYRDWVIRSFATNLAYDHFLVQQLAGDLLPNASDDQVVATGFIRCHVTTTGDADLAEEKVIGNFDKVETMGVVFLGLSLRCARCHDHKYDPITAKEYYQLYAFFDAIDDSGPSRPYCAAPALEFPSAQQVQTRNRLRYQTDALQQMVSTELENIREVTDVEQGTEPEDSLAAWTSQSRSNLGRGIAKPVRTYIIKKPANITEAQQRRIRDYFIQHEFSKTFWRFESLNRQLAHLAKEQAALNKTIPATMIYRESVQRKPCYLLKRGQFDRPGEEVERGTPAFLPPFPDDQLLNRLGLARWMTAPDHPLTARVAVNRFWQQCFGTGIVKTPDDFGTQGEPPSHPKLLDWLALKFMEDGWDVKQMMRRLVTSAAYRQSSCITPERIAKDPKNRLLSRGPRFRLDAEILRDQALAVSGLLVEQLYGPSLKPPQPEGLWEAVAYTSSNTAKFKADTEREKVYRRSLYTFWKRTAPPPQMTILDAPSRETCVVCREQTNTPLQALLLMNERQYMEAARALADRALREGGRNLDDRLAYMFRLVTARRPDPAELAELRKGYLGHRKSFACRPDQAYSLIAMGPTKPDADVDPVELAALTLVANLLLNLDEVLTKG